MVADRAVMVFARAPELGLVKTRLSRVLGAERTLSLYRAFLSDSLLAARRTGALVVLARTPGPSFPELDQADLSLVQRGDGFGARFDSATQELARLQPDAWRTLVIGADTPHLSPARLETAFNALRSHASVIGPSDDGGFYLLGFAGEPPLVGKVFENPESAAARLETALRERGDFPLLLPRDFDVDSISDLKRLRGVLRETARAGDGWLPPLTSRLLHRELAASP